MPFWDFAMPFTPVRKSIDKPGNSPWNTGWRVKILTGDGTILAESVTIVMAV